MIAKQYEECRGKLLDTELKMIKVLGILPKDLRSKVRSKLLNEEDSDESILIIMDELQDFVTGRVPVVETTKTNVHSVEQLPSLSKQDEKWEEDWCEDEHCEEAKDAYDTVRVALDSFKCTGKGGQKGKGAGIPFQGNCHCCGLAGHRASECRKKTRRS